LFWIGFGRFGKNGNEVEKYEIKVLNTSKVVKYYFINMSFWFGVVILTIILTWNITENRELLAYMITLVPLVFMIGLSSYIFFQLKQSCILELNEDELTQKFLKRSFGKIPKDIVITYDNIKAYKSYIFSGRGSTCNYLNIKLLIPEKKKICLSVVKRYSTKDSQNFDQFENSPILSSPTSKNTSAPIQKSIQ
jgi:hypothetical protein